MPKIVCHGPSRGLRSVFIMLLCLLSSVQAEQPPEIDEPASAASLGTELPRPHWQQGDRWMVETVSRPMQVRFACPPGTFSLPIPWQFMVVQSEVLDAHECFRIEIRCQAAGKQPATTLWLDRNSLALRQITTQVPVPNGFQEMTMRYDFTSGQTAPVLGPLTSLPIDTPVFLANQTKGLEAFTYRLDFGPRQGKAVGDIGFTHQIEQHVKTLSTGETRALLEQPFAKRLLGEALSKSLTSRPLIEVRLKSHGREVRQLWQAQRPWPIYSDNGQTISRFVTFMPATENEPSSHLENRP